MRRAARLYPIVDLDAVGAVPIARLVALYAEAGVEWIQLRDKRSSDAARFGSAREVAAARGRSTLWLNDRVDIALLVGADGVHLGQEDLPPSVCRRLAPALSVGRSTHGTEEVAIAHADDDVDVVAIGPVFSSATKSGHAQPVGVEGVRAARRLTSKPLVAIGGIDLDSIAAVLAAGADRIALIGALRGHSLAQVERKLAAMIAAIPDSGGAYESE